MKHWIKKYLVWVILAGIILGAIFLVGTSHKQPEFNIGKVIRSDLIQRVTIAGNVVPNRKTVISAPYPGYIKKIFVRIGQQVRAGDPIVTLAQSLRGNEDESFPLRAPFPGTVVLVLRTEGEYVDLSGGQTTGNALVRIDDLSHMLIEASVPEIEIDKLKIGQEALVKASAVLNRSYKGKIERLSLAAKEQRDWDKSRVEFPIVISVEDPDSELKPGMSVVADIVAKKVTNVLTLRHEFIQKNNDDKDKDKDDKKDDKYLVITEAGLKKSIEVGMQNEDAFEIKSGLSEGEKIRQTDFLSTLK